MFRSVPTVAIAIVLLTASPKPMPRSPDSVADPGRMAPPRAEIAPFALILSSGGGFAGSYRGYTLVFPDSVAAWRQRASGPRVEEWARKADPDSLIRFSSELETYAGVALDGIGNMTARIEYVSDGKKRSWSIAGTPGTPEAPEPFRTWYPRVAEYCRGLGRNP